MYSSGFAPRTYVVKGLGGSEALRRYLCSAVDAAGDGSMSEDMANLQHCS